MIVYRSVAGGKKENCRDSFVPSSDTACGLMKTGFGKQAAATTAADMTETVKVNNDRSKSLRLTWCLRLAERIWLTWCLGLAKRLWLTWCSGLAKTEVMANLVFGVSKDVKTNLVFGVS